MTMGTWGRKKSLRDVDGAEATGMNHFISEIAEISIFAKLVLTNSSAPCYYSIGQRRSYEKERLFIL